MVDEYDLRLHLRRLFIIDRGVRDYDDQVANVGQSGPLSDIGASS
jgi:hypothetical protein